MPAPEDVQDILDIPLGRVNFGQGSGLAPNDCTALGAIQAEETTTYASFPESGGAVAVNVYRFADSATATTLLARIREDIQDCDRSEHPLYREDFEAITDVAAGDDSFVLSTTGDDDRRSREIWAHSANTITHVSVLDLDPSVDQCTALAELAGEALPQG
ncbi:MAG: hypothetical protein R3320_11840 [Nitriliruptorales bacterium]|nr:hypothetical protein [Nitriliruptorales bacterium]